jgi:DnaJ-class molecular chaperone
MGLAEQLEAAFKTSDLYKVRHRKIWISNLTIRVNGCIGPLQILNTNKSATATEIKSAYYKAALKLHPDRAPDEKKEQVC